MQMKGLPARLNAYDAREVITSKHFQEFKLPEFDRFYLPESMAPFVSGGPVESREFILDDNRSAICPERALSIDRTDFYLSVKGIGSTTSPLSHRLLSRAEVSPLIRDLEFRNRIENSKESEPRYLTGELWLRGSPYGGQGLEHAMTSLSMSETADVTSINGFRIAPLVKIVSFPSEVEEKIKQIFWYRRFSGRIVQEIRIVPSNIRIYFHSGSTIGGNARSIYEIFGIDSDEKARRFIRNFVRSGIAYLTLFARSMRESIEDSVTGLDFYDVWLDKDAVIAPDGTIYFVDLEGLQWVKVPRKGVEEKIHDQIFRSLYEFMYAYEQLESARASMFGSLLDRKKQFEVYLWEALADDEIISIYQSAKGIQLRIGNILGERMLESSFPIIDY